MWKRITKDDKPNDCWECRGNINEGNVVQILTYEHFHGAGWGSSVDIIYRHRKCVGVFLSVRKIFKLIKKIKSAYDFIRL